MSVIRRPFFIETTTFPDKGSENTFSNMSVDYSTVTNIENIYDMTDNTQGVLNVKFRNNLRTDNTYLSQK